VREEQPVALMQNNNNNNNNNINNDHWQKHKLQQSSSSYAKTRRGRTLDSDGHREIVIAEDQEERL